MHKHEQPTFLSAPRYLSSRVSDGVLLIVFSCIGLENSDLYLYVCVISIPIPISVSISVSTSISSNLEIKVCEYCIVGNVTSFPHLELNCIAWYAIVFCCLEFLYSISSYSEILTFLFLFLFLFLSLSLSVCLPASVCRGNRTLQSEMLCTFVFVRYDLVWYELMPSR